MYTVIQYHIHIYMHLSCTFNSFSITFFYRKCNLTVHGCQETTYLTSLVQSSVITELQTMYSGLMSADMSGKISDGFKMFPFGKSLRYLSLRKLDDLPGQVVPASSSKMIPAWLP